MRRCLSLVSFMTPVIEVRVKMRATWRLSSTRLAQDMLKTVISQAVSGSVRE